MREPRKLEGQTRRAARPRTLALTATRTVTFYPSSPSVRPQGGTSSRVSLPAKIDLACRQSMCKLLPLCHPSSRLARRPFFPSCRETGRQKNAWVHLQLGSSKGVPKRARVKTRRLITRFSRVFDGKKGKGSVGDDWDAIAAEENALYEGQAEKWKAGKAAADPLPLSGTAACKVEWWGGCQWCSTRRGCSVEGYSVSPPNSSISVCDVHPAQGGWGAVLDGELLVIKARSWYWAVGHMVHGGTLVPYGVSDDIVKIMTADELKPRSYLAG